MEEDIVISKAKVGDEVGIAYVAKETWLVTYPNEKLGITKADILSKDFDSKEKLKKWRNIIKNSGKNKYLCVAKYKNRVVGFCMVSKNKNLNELNVIYVLPKYQRIGLGKRLLDKAISWLGSKNISVMVASYNKNAINFYKKSGFVKTKITGKKKLPSGKVIPEIQLVLKVKKSQNNE